MQGLVACVSRHKAKAAIVLTTLGSLAEPRLRLANRRAATVKKGHVELAGTLDLTREHDPASGDEELKVMKQ